MDYTLTLIDAPTCIRKLIPDSLNLKPWRFTSHVRNLGQNEFRKKERDVCDGMVGVKKEQWRI